MGDRRGVDRVGWCAVTTQIKAGDTIVVTGTIPVTTWEVGDRAVVLRVWPHAKQAEVQWEKNGAVSFLFTDDPVEVV